MQKISESDSRIYDKVDVWSEKLADQIEKEFISIPDAVIAMACIKALKRAVRRSSVLTTAAALKIVANELEADLAYFPKGMPS